MSIVLVCIDNFQEYILDNIKQLINLNHKNICVLTNQKFFSFFDDYKNGITLINCEDLIDSYNFYSSLRCDNEFRNGFFKHTSKRFFLLYSYMKEYNVSDVFHIENEVLLYFNCDTLLPNLDEDRLCVPADSYLRSIASIMYIPHHAVLKCFLDVYDNRENDMVNLSRVQRSNPKLFNNFPICFNMDTHTSEQLFVSKDFAKFNMIFDAAAIGQYLGGVDPRNIPGNSSGFINETTVIKYNEFEFTWMNGLPFMQGIPIFNLHIHSKNLAKFIQMPDTSAPVICAVDIMNTFDVVVPVGPNDISKIDKTIECIKKNIIGYRNIFIISKSEINILDCIFVNENIFPFTMETISLYLGINERNGWYLQQLIKLCAGHIPDLLNNYLVIDSDTFFLKPTSFFSNDLPLYNVGSEYYKPYFNHLLKMHNSLTKQNDYSGICHHMLFQQHILKQLFKLVEDYHRDDFWKCFLSLIDKKDIPFSGASEYELYFNYIHIYHPDSFMIRKLEWLNSGTIDETLNLHYVSCHWYM